VSKEDGVVFGFAGLLAWMAATAFYLAFGAGLLEQAFWFYALNAILNAAAVMVVFQSVARLRRTPYGRRVLPALIFATPGLLCGSTTLINFAALAGPGAQPESAGRYGAFLLCGYALLLASAMRQPRKGMG
jgi:hypothetical protein